MSAVQLHQESAGQAARPAAKPPLRTRIASVLVALGIMAGIGLTTAAPSQASTTYCGNGACTVYLNWTETVNLSNGRPPRVITPVPQLTVAINAGLWGHVLIAKGWVWRGNCVAFTANVRPWASQGMTGWRCR